LASFNAALPVAPTAAASVDAAKPSRRYHTRPLAVVLICIISVSHGLAYFPTSTARPEQEIWVIGWGGGFRVSP